MSVGSLPAAGQVPFKSLILIFIFHLMLSYCLPFNVEHLLVAEFNLGNNISSAFAVPVTEI